jgi:hypothetical protein
VAAGIESIENEVSEAVFTPHFKPQSSFSRNFHNVISAARKLDFDVITVLFRRNNCCPKVAA